MKTKGKFFLAVSLILLLAVLIVPYYIYVGRNTTISNDGKDWADFAAYFAAFGTMFFTALYAFAFIKLQGAINLNTEAQEAKNIKQQYQKTLLYIDVLTVNNLNQSLEIAQSIELKNKMTTEQYNALINLSNQILVNMEILQEKSQKHEICDDKYFVCFNETYKIYRGDLESMKSTIFTDNNKSLLVAKLQQMTNILKSIELIIMMKFIEN